MRKNLLFNFLLLISCITAQNSNIIRDKKSIKSMCGCFEVGFNFIETFSYSNDSNYIRYQLWRLVEIYNAHNTYNANINSIIEAYILERDSTDDWVNHYDYKLQIDDNLTISLTTKEIDDWFASGYK